MRRWENFIMREFKSRDYILLSLTSVYHPIMRQFSLFLKIQNIKISTVKSHTVHTIKIHMICDYVVGR